MKALSASERYGWVRHVAHQAFYSLAAREFEWELMPLGLDQGVGTVVWSPLAQSRLTGKVRRGQPVPTGSRLRGGSETEQSGDEETLLRTVDVLDQLAQELGRTIPQVALNWVLQRATVSSVVFGARDERQLRENLGAVGWDLTLDQVARLDRANATTPIYPYWHQLQHSQVRNPFPTDVRPRS